MGYLALLHTKMLEKKLEKKARAEAKHQATIFNFLEKELKWAEQKKQMATVFLETLIENGAPEERCIPYANRAAEIEEEISVKKQELDIFEKEGRVLLEEECVLPTEYSSPPFSPEFIRQFTEAGKDVYLHAKERIAAKYSRGVADEAAVA